MRKIFIKILGYIGYLSIPSSVTVFIHKLRGVKIGKGSRIHRFVYIDEYCPEKIFIGSHVGVGAKSIIIAHERDFINEKRNSIYSEIEIKKQKIVINDYAYIGIGAIILPGVTIGKGSVIGAGAVVTSDIPPYSIAVGVPAKVIKSLRK